MQQEKKEIQATMERVPRYTSYPTAPHFHEGIGAKDYGKWLKSLDKNNTLSLYFHIPYCKNLCWFCGCHTKIVNHYDPILRYLDLLKQEIELISHDLKDVPVKHIHFGGGSPTVLKSTDFSNLMKALKSAFVITPEAEIAVEMDPRTTDVAKIEAFAHSGVTRASLGVQDFDEKVQKAINRLQPYESVRKTIDDLRINGIQSLNIDLIYGLPHQTLETTQDTIEKTLSLEPDRISLFGYAHVPWMKKHQQHIQEDSLPGEEYRIALSEHAENLLLKAGYIAIGLDHFAKPEDSLSKSAREGKLQRNFQGYTTDTADALIGMGISSISSLPQGYAQNTSSNRDYAQLIKSERLPIFRGYELSQEDKQRREIISSLMCHMSAKVDSSHYLEELNRLEPYIHSRDVLYENGIVKIFPQARIRLRTIASIFDSYLINSKHRHSNAV
ncbi:MAG: oxygen-independent coproporphyrinogen III oxidase [bacterium]|nr:oxygen-independent coproporphyrinogen III oxidase [bacterium]